MHNPLALITALITTVFRAWRPVTLKLPKIEPDLEGMSASHRVSESLRYYLLSFEYWLSPGGSLRAWLGLNIVAALVIGIPVLLLFPIITAIFGAVAVWSEIAVQIATHAMTAALLVAMTTATLMATHAASKAYLQHNRQASRRGRR